MKKLSSLLILILFLVTSANATTWYLWRYRTHVSDCTSITDGRPGDLCYEEDDEILYICDTTDGLCDTAAEWEQLTLCIDSGGVAKYDSNRNITDLCHLVDKKYVDGAVTALGARYYMTNNDFDETGYKLCSLAPSSGAEQSVSKTNLGDGDYVVGWISPNANEPDKLVTGVFNWRIYAEKTSGTKTLRLYWKLVERNNDSEVVIGTSVVSNEITTGKNSYIIPLTISADHDVAADSYIVGKIYADVSGNGLAPSVTLYYEGDSDSHWEIPVNTEILDDSYVNADGDTMMGALNLPVNGLVVGTDQLVLSNNNVGIRTVNPNHTLEVNGILGSTADNITIDDSGDANPASYTLTPSSSFVKLTCNDTNGCNITIGEAGMTDGGTLTIVNVSANVCNFSDSAGISELAGAAAISQYGVLSLIYVEDRWVEVSRSNN
ncbi:hypothetical protein DRO59_06910 [Candidatus Bathyarchaeota archaeon]|nr:MAG: hypothetical protein DRO59_06910 [Candidatus Bathyarchaeota archaeon]